MQIPLQIAFQHMRPSPTIEAMIGQQSAKLERFYDRIVSCRVVVEASTRAARQYQVRVDVMVPGGELVASREPGWHRDLSAALHEAFDVIRRQLEDFARRQRGDVKVHA